MTKSIFLGILDECFGYKETSKIVTFYDLKRTRSKHSLR